MNKIDRCALVPRRKTFKVPLSPSPAHYANGVHCYPPLSPVSRQLLGKAKQEFPVHNLIRGKFVIPVDQSTPIIRGIFGQRNTTRTGLHYKLNDTYY